MYIEYRWYIYIYIIANLRRYGFTMALGLLRPNDNKNHLSEPYNLYNSYLAFLIRLSGIEK